MPWKKVREANADRLTVKRAIKYLPAKLEIGPDATVKVSGAAMERAEARMIPRLTANFNPLNSRTRNFLT